ncbi:hypothetical protein OG809_33185 [Kribbella soli]
MNLWTRIRSQIKQAGANIQAGKHLEAYVVFLLGLALAVLSFLDAVDQRVVLAGVLLGLSFLVFHSTQPDRNEPTGTQLRGRESFGTFPALLEGTRELWVCAPTAANILGHAADIRRHLLDRGGTARFMVQDPKSPAVEASARRLENNIDFRSALDVSVGTLRRLREQQPNGFEYGLLPFSPGYSLVIVDPNSYSGYVILETHGFRDENIADRMHITIYRSESARWFDYWKATFHQMWLDSLAPLPDGNQGAA